MKRNEGIMIGLSDGLAIPLVIVSGLSAVVESNSMILTAGFSAIAAGALAMTVGGYDAGKTERSDHEAMAADYSRGAKPANADELDRFLAGMDISAETREKVLEEVLQDHQKLADLIRDKEDSHQADDERNLIGRAVSIGSSYIGGGLVPVIPYFFFDEPLQALPVSAVLSLVALFIIGYSRYANSGKNPLAAAFRLTLISGLAAFAVYAVALMVKST